MSTPTQEGRQAEEGLQAQKGLPAKEEKEGLPATGDPPTQEEPPTKENPETLEMRARPKPVKRLNRHTMVVLVGSLLLAIVLAVMWGLRKPAPKKPAESQEAPPVSRVARAEGFESLPHDYASLHDYVPRPQPPQLGPPGGELGGPILKAEQQAGIPELPERENFRPNPEEDAMRAQRLKEQSEADEASKAQVLVKLDQRVQGPAAAAQSGSAIPIENGLALPREPAPADPNKQARKQAFVEKEADSRIYASASLQTPVSPYQLMAGTIIAAALITGINSDLPGEVTAGVTENVFDTVTGRYLLIPQGARLIGQYDSQVAYGQRRVLLVWTRLIMPDGSSIVLDRLPASDTQGYSGLEDKVNWHWGRIFEGAAVSTLLGVTAQLASPDQTNNTGTVVIATRQSLGDTVNQVGQEMTRRNLDIQPTLTERPGLPVRIIVNRDIVLKPYKS
jgi:type IV secretion system protein TrbI